MSILGAKSKRKEHKLIGASLPQWVHSYLTLYCLANGISKSSVIKGCIEAWIVIQRRKQSDVILCTEIASRINEEWLVKIRTLSTVSFIDFKKTVACELHDKGLHAADIDIILSKLIK